MRDLIPSAYIWYHQKPRLNPPCHLSPSSPRSDFTSLRLNLSALLPDCSRRNGNLLTPFRTMTICEYCIEALFEEKSWGKSREKSHHTEVARWQDSIRQCTICSCLLDAIKDALLKKMESNISNTLDTYLRFEAVLNAGVLGLLKSALPIYTVVLQESAAREQYVLIFQPVEENVSKIDYSSPFGTVAGLVLPTRKFQVYSTIYDDNDIPRLSNETSLDVEANSRNKRTVDQITGWTRKCNEEHAHCGHFAKLKHRLMTEERSSDKKSFVPTRLIEVGLRGDNHVCLVETDGKDEFQCYASLRYQISSSPKP